jgi:hypothetical protein
MEVILRASPGPTAAYLLSANPVRWPLPSGEVQHTCQTGIRELPRPQTGQKMLVPPIIASTGGKKWRNSAQLAESV